MQVQRVVPRPRSLGDATEPSPWPEQIRRPRAALHRHAAPAVLPPERPAFLLSLACLFALLAAYYVLKPIRGQILQTRIGVDRKGLAILATAAYVALQAHVYGAAASRARARDLVVGTFALVVLLLFAFLALLERVRGSWVGFAFYAWVSGMSLLVISQFWSIATDVFTHEQGARLFGFIGVGAVLGSLTGNLTVVTFGHRLGTSGLLCVAAAWLAIGLTCALGLLARRAPRPVAPLREPIQDARGPAALVLRSPYLIGIAAMSLLLNLVNTSNEWLFDKVVSSAALSSSELQIFYGRYMLDQNLLTLGLQLVVTSRLQRRIGAGTALFALPLVSVIGGLAFFVAPTLDVARALKVAENATDYSIHASSRELLYVPVTARERYGAKNFNDTFVVRAGDALAAAGVILAADVLGPRAVPRDLGALAVVGAILAVAATAVIRDVAKQHAQRVAADLSTDAQSLPAQPPK